MAKCNREPRFAPYIFLDNSLDFKLVEFHKQHGINAFSLAFALSDNGACKPSWFNSVPIDDPAFIKEIQAFRALGGQLIVSTGGAGGLYLENWCHSVQELTAAYKQVLSVTGATGLDVDLEMSIPLDTVMGALVAIQKENPNITVSFTVPTQGDDYGMNDPYGVDVLKSAAAHGVNVDVVNVMVMNFHTSQPGRSYGEAITKVGEFSVQQMAKIWPQKSETELYGMLGLTPMLGLNNNQEHFMQSDAQAVVAFAKQKQIGHLGFWSINRDKQCRKVSPKFNGNWVEPDPDCSNVQQQAFEFTDIFNTIFQ
ncbi:unnamed protein product, partial [Medioppia subpectinata]